MEKTKKKYKLSLIVPKWSNLYLLFSSYNYFVRINGKDVRGQDDRDELNYDEMLAVWKFAVKNRNKLENLYLEKVYASLKIKEEVKRDIEDIGKSKTNKNGRVNART
mgnify:CR=1 FL=1